MSTSPDDDEDYEAAFLDPDPPLLYPEAPPDDAPHGPNGARVNGANGGGAAEPGPETETEEGTGQGEEHPGRAGFKLTLFRDIDATPRKHWIVDDLLGEGEFTVWFGPPGSGKSVLVGDAACHVAAGRPWLGKAVAGGAVLYVAAERAPLVKRRMAAWRKRYKIHDLPLAVVEGVFNLSSSQEDVEGVLESIAELRTATGKTVTWVIVDTKAQVMGGGDENGARDMMGLVASCARLQADAERDQGWRPHLTVIDHVPHDAPHRMRGHGSLLGAADSTFRVTKEDSLRLMEGDKANDAPDDLRLAFTLESVTLSVDPETGKETTAPVVVAADPTVATVTKRHGDGRARGPKLSGQMRKAAEVITMALAEAGTPAPAHVAERAPRGAITVSKEMLDRYFVTASLIDPANKRAVATFWWRVRKELLGEVVDAWADHFWLKARASPIITSDITGDGP